MVAMGNLAHCLLASVGGNSSLVDFPGQNNYNTILAPYNLDVSSIPKAVIFPQSAQQVAKAVACAVKAGVKVQPRCGGHNYANYGI